MDRRTYELCYPGLGVGEIESMSGGVFGHAFLAINPILLRDENPRKHLGCIVRGTFKAGLVLKRFIG